MLQQDQSVELKETMGFVHTLVALTAAAVIYNVLCLDVQNQNQKCETLPSQINVIKGRCSTHLLINVKFYVDKNNS